MQTDYDKDGHGYSAFRQTEPRIAARIKAALGDARTVLNVGAGAGSYEPADRYVLAVEPAATMRAQRPAGAAPAVAASAEALPFDDDSFDAAMALVTIHHWSDPVRGLNELRRVARGPVLVLTFDIAAFERYWLVSEYIPELAAVERALFLPLQDTVAALGGEARIEPVAIPFDCRDGFIEAYYGRPERYLDPAVRAAQSAWGRLPDGVEARAVQALESDLAGGAWDRRHEPLRRLPEYESTLRLVVSNPEGFATGLGQPLSANASASANARPASAPSARTDP
jgi:SAM-dependent methyltransferase